MQTREILITDDGEILKHATIPFGNAKGFETDKILVNEAGTQFHCATCDFQAGEYAAVFAHRRKHGAVRPRKAREPQASPLDTLRAQAAGLVEAIDTAIEAEIGVLMKRAQDAEARAKVAERSLNTLRKALRGVEQV